MNKLAFGANLLKSKVTHERIPFQVNIHINDVCNLRCKYCYVDFDNASKDFPLEQLKQIIQEAVGMGTIRFSLEGGEPLIRNDIGQIVNFIRDLGAECNINTNGYLVPRRIDELKRLNILSVSLDGDKETHDKIRGAGSFEKAIEAVRIAKEHGIKVHVLSVLNKVNRASLDFMLDLADKMRFQFVPNTLFFNPDMNQRDLEREKEYVLSDQEYRDLIWYLYERKKKGARIVWSLDTLQYVANWPLSYQKSNMWNFEVPDSKHWKPVPCVAGTNFCVIQTNGDLFTCDPMLGYGKTANCIELGFKKAYEQLSIGKCVACTSLVCTEYHHLFNLNPSVIMNLAKNYGKNT